MLKNYPCFWPTKLGEEIQYGPLTVKLSKEELTGAITVRDFCIRKVRRQPAQHPIGTNSTRNLESIRYVFAGGPTKFASATVDVEQLDLKTEYLMLAMLRFSYRDVYRQDEVVKFHDE